MPSHGETTGDMCLCTYLVLRCTSNDYYTHRKAQPTHTLDASYSGLEGEVEQYINTLSQKRPSLPAAWV